MAKDHPEYLKWKAQMNKLQEEGSRIWGHMVLSITERSQALFDEMKIDADPQLATRIATLVFGPYGPPPQQEDDAASGTGINVSGLIVPPLSLGRFYCRQLHHWVSTLQFHAELGEEWHSAQARRAEFDDWEDWYTSFDDGGFFPAATELETEMWRLAAEHFGVSGELHEELVDVTNRLMMLQPWSACLHRKIGKLEVYRALLALGLTHGLRAHP